MIRFHRKSINLSLEGDGKLFREFIKHLEEVFRLIRVRIKAEKLQ